MYFDRGRKVIFLTDSCFVDPIFIDSLLTFIDIDVATFSNVHVWALLSFDQA